MLKFFAVVSILLFLVNCQEEPVSWEDYYPPFEDFGVSEPAIRLASIPNQIEEGTFYRCIGYFSDIDVSVINEWKRDTGGQFQETNRFEFVSTESDIIDILPNAVPIVKKPGRVWPC